MLLTTENGNELHLLVLDTVLLRMEMYAAVDSQLLRWRHLLHRQNKWTQACT